MKDCVLIKQKEYDELLKKAELLKEATKPEEIKIILNYKRPSDMGFYIIDPVVVESSFSLSEGISYQIKRILNTLRETFDKKIDILNNKYKADKGQFQIKYKEELERKVNKLSRRNKRLFIKGDFIL